MIRAYACALVNIVSIANGDDRDEKSEVLRCAPCDADVFSCYSIAGFFLSTPS